MKVEKVGLDSKRIRTKRWTIAHIRDRIKLLNAHARAGNIDAIFRHEFLIARQVDGWHRVLRSITATASGRAQNAERTPQQMPCPAHSSINQQLSNMAAGNRLAPQGLLLINLHFEAHLL